jgi:hypothetical protein
MIVVICPTAQGKMCTTGNLRMAPCVLSSLQNAGPKEEFAALRRHREHSEAIQNASEVKVWIASSRCSSQ